MRNYMGLIDSLMAYVQNCVAANRCDDKVSVAPEGQHSRAPTHTAHLRRQAGGQTVVGRGTEAAVRPPGRRREPSPGAGRAS